MVKWLGIGLVGLAILAFGALSYFKSQALARLEKKYQVPARSIPIPFPLSETELAELREQRRRASASGTGVVQAGAEGAAAEADPLAGVDLSALALERALARGKHYLESRAGCPECHGKDLSGGVVIDNPVMGKWIAPNITRGGKTKSYKSEDWVRLIRHGVKPDGSASSMPSMDFTNFSDQEISDIAAYVQSLPAVDKEMPPTELGPVFALLIAQGEIPISADVIDHEKPRAVYPPSTGAVSLELGKHLGTTCVGCHGQGLSGGPVRGGDPSWPPAKNLTFHETGLASWSQEDFVKAMRTGVRPDGSKIGPPMVISYTAQLEDNELASLYVYLQTVPKKPFGQY